MEKYITILTLIFSLSVFSNVSAQALNSQEKKDEVKAKVEQLEEKQKALEEKKEEKVSLLQTIISKFKKTEVENLKVKTLKNFDVAIRNLENLSKRIMSRIEKIESLEKDVTESKKLLASSTIEIENAKLEYKKLSEIIPDSFDKDSKKETKEAVKEQTRVTKQTIQKAQEYLSETIASIKFGQADLQDEQSTTTIINLK